MVLLGTMVLVVCEKPSPFRLVSLRTSCGTKHRGGRFQALDDISDLLKEPPISFSVSLGTDCGTGNSVTPLVTLVRISVPVTGPGAALVETGVFVTCT